MVVLYFFVVVICLFFKNTMQYLGYITYSHLTYKNVLGKSYP